MARKRISVILLNKQKAEFITKFEDELYNDAVSNENVTFYNKKKKVYSWQKKFS